MRQQIAAAAARLIAEDGIDDYALAKRKAARQLGAEDTHSLPNNDEIDAHLRTYQSLYQGDEQRERIAHLREQALEVMRMLEPYRPYLTGPVLKGTAPRYSDIDLHVFTDDAKAIELLLLNRGIAYEVAHQRHPAGEPGGVPVLRFDQDDTSVNVAVFSARDERTAFKSSGSHRTMERAAIAAVEQLLHDE
jgi:hypothetical protein